MRHARLGGLAMSRLGLRAMGISVTRSGAKPAVLVHERGQESATVPQIKFFCPNGRWWQVPGNR